MLKVKCMLCDGYMEEFDVLFKCMACGFVEFKF